AFALEAPAEAWAERDGPGERHHAADRVDDRRAGEVVEARADARKEVAFAAHGGEEAVRAPRPVADDRIDEARNAKAVDQVADEAGAADHGARGDGRAGVGEGE